MMITNKTVVLIVVKNLRLSFAKMLYIVRQACYTMYINTFTWETTKALGGA